MFLRSMKPGFGVLALASCVLAAVHKCIQSSHVCVCACIHQQPVTSSFSHNSSMIILRCWQDVGMKSVQELHIGVESGAVKFEKRTPAAQSEGRVHTVQHVQRTGFAAI